MTVRLPFPEIVQTSSGVCYRDWLLSVEQPQLSVETEPVDFSQVISTINQAVVLRVFYEDPRQPTVDSHEAIRRTIESVRRVHALCRVERVMNLALDDWFWLAPALDEPGI